MPDAADPTPPDAPAPACSSRAAWVDAAMSCLAAGPIVAVLLGDGDLFLLTCAALPVGVLLACSFDPLDPAELDRQRPPR